MSLPDASEASLAVSHHDMANAIRALSMDAVEAATCGHPGMPMGMADVATILFTRHLRYDAETPGWPDRDRFVLSAGHGSMLLYALLYLTGNPDINLEEIKNFRQLGSSTAGHPEYGHIRGIETTTGPLGQGLGNAVGMAIAERHLAARFGEELVNHHTFVLASDGDLMEGISHEAASLAGHLRLSKLIVLFDDNGISIDGPTDLSVSDDQLARFRAYGWDAESIDGHDPDAVAAAIDRAKSSDRPSLIACRTTIGYGAPNKQGTSGIHGAAMGTDEIAATREALGWASPPFEIPEDILSAWREAGQRGAQDREAWDQRLGSTDKPKADEYWRVINGVLSCDWEESLLDFKRSLVDEAPTWASRKSSQEALEVINPGLPETVGGSADLTGSNNTKTKSFELLTADNYGGRYIHYGVREHAMGAVMNGMALHGGIIPYGGTFLVFTDYLRPALRLSALMKQRTIHVMTHDSIGLGEDGPTHQPIEHLASLRAIPNVAVFRPSDAIETAECWALALKRSNGPSVIALSRQGLPPVRTSHSTENLCEDGAYELSPADGQAKATLIATGSETAIALDAQSQLQDDGIPTRVVSMPCQELFDERSQSDRNEVLQPGTVRVAIEAAATMGWHRYVGDNGAVIGMESFGASAPAKDLFSHFGITAEAVVDAVKARLT
ncbi:MAG: transketolase [Alphaproteobacteria bacterium]|nr:transketolase [Alphaproteobacteria bacterium]